MGNIKGQGCVTDFSPACVVGSDLLSPTSFVQRFALKFQNDCLGFAIALFLLGIREREGELRI